MAPAVLSPARALATLERAENDCSRCSRATGRRSYVFGEGNPKARLMIVGEAPGMQEDRMGRPFVGRAGRMLDSCIASIDLRRDDVYITNVFKCHPMKDPDFPDRAGNDRAPTKAEITACLPILAEQIEIIHPSVICTLGNSATRALLGTKEGVSRLHGTPADYHGLTVIPTYHPAAILRNPGLQRILLEDFKKIKALLSTTTRQ